MKTSVFVRLSVEGVHRWAACPFEEVSYLKRSHRHQFGIKCWKEVHHDDRDVEFIMMKHDVIRYLNSRYHSAKLQCLDFDKMSCEMIAKELIEHFGLIKCYVDEDGENGAEVES